MVVGGGLDQLLLLCAERRAVMVMVGMPVGGGGSVGGGGRGFGAGGRRFGGCQAICVRSGTGEHCFNI